MSFDPGKSAVIRSGWARALLLLIAHTGILLAAGELAAECMFPEAAVNGAGTGADTESSGFVSPGLPWFLFSFCISAGLVSLFLRYIDRKPFAFVGLQPQQAGRPVFLGLLTALLLISLGSLLVFVLGGIRWTGIWLNAEALFFSAVIMLLIAAAEELVFRGYILGNLLLSFNRATALLLSSACFTIMHTLNSGITVWGVFNIFLGGMVIGLSFIYSRNLWFALAFHFAWNFLQGPVMGFPVSGLPFESLLSLEQSGSTLLSGGAFGFEGSLICSILLLCTLAGMLARLQNRMRSAGNK